MQPTTSTTQETTMTTATYARSIYRHMSREDRCDAAATGTWTGIDEHVATIREAGIDVAGVLAALATMCRR